MSTNVLAVRDVNTSSPNNGGAHAEDGKQGIKSMEYHRQVLQSRQNEDDASNKYVSPSDNIMSPTTQKISALKNKRFASAKPQSLFARTSSKNALASGLGADIPSKSAQGQERKSSKDAGLSQ